MSEKIKQFFNSPFGKHLYSFAKTYVTAFIATYLALNGLLDIVADKISLEQMNDLNLADISILAISAKFAFISVLRNVYKLLTEK